MIVEKFFVVESGGGVLHGVVDPVTGAALGVFVILRVQAEGGSITDVYVPENVARDFVDYLDTRLPPT